MKQTSLSNFQKLFQSGKNFSITEKQYQTEVGRDFPKMPYLQNSSALARMAKEYGYELKIESIIVHCEKKGELK